MRDLTKEERETLLLIKDKGYLNKNNGYFRFTFKKKHYKRSRVLIQLHLNKKLEIWENVHHKDNNKENDYIYNLEVVNVEEHISQHHAGAKRKKEI